MNRDPAALIDAYVDGVIDDTGFEALCDWLRADAVHRRVFALALADHAGIADWADTRSGGALLPELEAGLVPQDSDDAWMDQLAALRDRAGAPELVNLQAEAPCHELAASQPAEGVPVASVDEAPKRLVIVIPWSVAGLMAAAVLVLIFVVARFWLASSPAPVGPRVVGLPVSEPPPVVATVMQAVRAVWVESPGVDLRGVPVFRSGDSWTLLSGVVEAETEAGAVFRVEGPATFTVEGGLLVRLARGTLTAEVRDARAAGFTVVTPSARFTDLGTEFGVHVSDGPSGSAEAFVFEGDIDVRSDRSARARRLTAEHGVRVSRAGAIRVDRRIDQGRYLLSVDDLDYRPGVAGDVRWLPTPPPSLRITATMSSAYAYLFSESQSVVVDHPVPLFVSRPGVHDRFVESDAVPLPAGTLVDSYILHYNGALDDASLAGLGGRGVVRGTVTFPREVVGLVLDWDSLFASDAAFAASGVDYGAPMLRGIVRLPGFAPRDASPDSLETSNGDRFVLSEDRRTLTFEIKTGRIDQVRVIVQAQPSAGSDG